MVVFVPQRYSPIGPQATFLSFPMASNPQHAAENAGAGSLPLTEDEVGSVRLEPSGKRASMRAINLNFQVVPFGEACLSGSDSARRYRLAGEPLSRAIIFDPRLPSGFSDMGSEGKRAANKISQVRGVSLSQSGVGVVVSK
jgi:hypothetical protein